MATVTVELKPGQIQPIYRFSDVVEAVNTCNLVFADADAMWHFSAQEMAAILKGLADPIPTNRINIQEI